MFGRNLSVTASDQMILISNTGLGLVKTDHVTLILISDWFFRLDWCVTAVSSDPRTILCALLDGSVSRYVLSTFRV